MHRWWKRPDAGKGHGRVTLRFDDETPYVFWFDEEIRRSPAEFDRFGLFNIARFGTRVELYLGDLTVNGQRIDLTQDPHWEGRNNESRYTEPNFQAAHSYGWSQTNWAGEKPGEIGGLFWRTEPPDPLCSYYGDDVGELTLDDPISFSGTICFVDGMTDAAAYFGYFNRDNQVEAFDKAKSDAFSPVANTMGVAIADSSAVGYYFLPQVSSRDREVARKSCGVFTPDRRRHRFAFAYDPAGNGGDGAGDRHAGRARGGVRPDARAAEGGGDVQPLRAGERPQRRPFGRVLPRRPDLHGPRPVGRSPSPRRWSRCPTPMSRRGGGIRGPEWHLHYSSPPSSARDRAFGPVPTARCRIEPRACDSPLARMGPWTKDRDDE